MRQHDIPDHSRRDPGVEKAARPGSLGRVAYFFYNLRQTYIRYVGLFEKNTGDWGQHIFYIFYIIYS